MLKIAFYLTIFLTAFFHSKAQELDYSVNEISELGTIAFLGDFHGAPETLLFNKFYFENSKDPKKSLLLHERGYGLEILFSLSKLEKQDSIISFICNNYYFPNKSDYETLKYLSINDATIKAFDIDKNIHPTIIALLMYQSSTDSIAQLPNLSDWKELLEKAQSANSFTNSYYHNLGIEILAKQTLELDNDFVTTRLMKSLLEGIKFNYKKFQYREKLLFRNIKNIIDTTSSHTLITVGANHVGKGFFGGKLISKGYQIDKIYVLFNLRKPNSIIEDFKYFKELSPIRSKLPTNSLFKINHKNLTDYYFQFKN